MRRLGLVIALLSALTKFSLGQESILDLKDEVLKKEIGLFSIKSAALDSSFIKELTPIPIRNCTEKEIGFEGAFDTYIHLYFKGQPSGKALDSIFLVTHSHFWVKFPTSAYQGLLRPYECDFKNNGKRSAFFSPYYKAFYSKDKRRLYIYMQGETKSGKCEVTWVIVNGKYYTRVLDNIP